jgi:ubiquinone/menaquinone biosynthesis C-methylase UbiE
MSEIINIEKRVREALGEYRSGTWRAPLFRDFVRNDLCRIGNSAVVLDIGCGEGFDDSVKLQSSIGEETGQFWGVEPDPEIVHLPDFDELHNCGFEDSPLTNDSVDLAYATFVLEHIEDPAAFWNCFASVGR